MTTSFSTRTVPWLKIGTVIDHDVNAAEAAQLGGIDFTVDVRRSSFEGSRPGSWVVVPNRNALVRRDTNTFFDFVSDGYRVVQYREAFDFMDGINPRYVAAGPLRGGRQGFMVVQLPDRFNIDPEPNGESDPHQLYVVLRTSHDRSKAIEIAVLPLRERCMNQLALPSLTRDAPQRWSIRHVGDPHQKLKAAQNALTGTQRYAEVFQRTVRQLASVSIHVDDVSQVMRRVLPDRARRPEQIAAIEAAFRSSPHVGFPNTGWALVNAVSEYLEHGRFESNDARTMQSRFTGGLDGATAKYVGRTAQLVLTRA